jgi:hypothetical protein
MKQNALWLRSIDIGWAATPFLARAKKHTMKIEKTKLIIPLALVALATSAVGVVSIAHADTNTTAAQQSASQMHAQRTPPAAVGTVTAISGNSITLTDKKSNTTYTVDATNASITERTKSTTAPVAGVRPAPTTITVSQIAVGDTLMVQGTTSGTTITATKIADGVGGMGGFGGGHGGRGPGVMGTVTAVNGNTVTVTGKDGKSYTVDASASTVGKIQTITVAGIQVGDSVGIQGTVNGTSVTAKSIMDGMPAPQAEEATAGL